MTPKDRERMTDAAKRLVKTPVNAAVLVAILEGGGRSIGREEVALVPPSRGVFSKQREIMGGTRVFHVRRRLEDSGLFRVIETTPDGYRIGSNNRERIMARLAEYAG